MLFQRIGALLAALLLVSCSSAAQEPAAFPTYDPFVSLATPQSGTSAPHSTGTSSAASRPPTPTRAPLKITYAASGYASPTPRQNAEEYVVQPNDTLGIIAQRYRVSLQALMDANQLANADMLYVGMTLIIPAAQVGEEAAPSLKIIPDSELVNGPAAAEFDLRGFIADQNGFLADYEEDFRGERMSGADILEEISYNYSVNPRLLLALLEYQSGWVTQSAPSNIAYPMGYEDGNRVGLYRQTAWAANALNYGYYLWKVNGLSTWTFPDRQTISIDPIINAGTSALQYFFSKMYNYDAWQNAVGLNGVVVTYFVFFDNPFQRAVEPLVPATLTQPPMSFPFEAGEEWYFTGGPHGAWDSGSAWGALDFAPSDRIGECNVSAHWVTAMADGLVSRTGFGSVAQDLDNDGYEQTGLVVMYMHVAAEGRVAAGEYLFRNERIGHPSCEGGLADATHVHVIRKYNGEWIAADGALPFNFDGWISSGTGYEYDGYLVRDGASIEALNAADPENLIVR
ncbi:MAG: LysM peptidoglycan-binding domain-containing protein [Anaerolineales bacterium]|nr:LysM peptidoglycan-binding domain-containing protein [Anaerolineales bacterium]